MTPNTGRHRSPARSDYRWQASATGVSARLRALYPIGADTVWVAGAGGVVLRTIDAGQSWQRIDPPGAEDLQFRALVAVDAEQALLLSFVVHSRPASLRKSRPVATRSRSPTAMDP